MNPNEKGWLKEYLEFRLELLKDLTHDSDKKGSHPEQSLYRIVQPTGLMYGHTVGSLAHPSEQEWDEKDKMKILLAVYMLSSL